MQRYSAQQKAVNSDSLFHLEGAAEVNYFKQNDQYKKNIIAQGLAALVLQPHPDVVT